MGNNDSFRSARSKILRRSVLVNAVQEAKTRGKTVVLTNGCFDILHVGHLRYLEQARALGDLLVVGVNSDDSVRRLKGPDRPIVREFERVEVLAALECVDYVTIFTEDTPVELILAVKPHIHVKGGDRRPEEMPEREAVLSVGGRIEIVSYTSTDSEGLSTTAIIGRITQNAETKGSKIIEDTIWSDHINVDLQKIQG